MLAFSNLKGWAGGKRNRRKMEGHRTNFGKVIGTNVGYDSCYDGLYSTCHARDYIYAQTSHNDTWKQARQIELRSRTSHNKQNFDAGMEQLVAFEEAG